MTDQNPRAGMSRRAFLSAGAATTALVAAGPLAGRASAATPAPTPAPPSLYGAHQPGILELPQLAHVVVSLDLTTRSRSELEGYFRTLTSQITEMVAGGPVTEAFNAGIAPDNGMLGPVVPAGQLTPTVSVGASLFDNRFGLGRLRPVHLSTMESFPNDDLDQSRCHGDVLVQFQAADRDTVTHALRRIMQATDGVVQPRWREDGFVNPPRPTPPARNLFGFNDPVSNPDVTDPAQMDALVWADPSTEPTWAGGGSYVVVRVIRQLVEFWDRVSVEEQELMIGRRRDTGAPLGENDIDAAPDFAADPQGATTPLTAHIRVANPRTPATADSRILRRGVNYDRGLDTNGNLDMGLVFIAYNQDIGRQFDAVQTRLIDEPMVDYVSPVGGGYFFALPGLSGPDDYYAQGLLTA